MRKESISRKTKETDIQLKLNIDGTGKNQINTGVGFFDHMLELFSHHSKFDLEVACNGDVKVDGHHSIEDIGIVLGKAFDAAIGDKKGIARYASVFVPMDESLALVSLDISGRPYLVYDVDIDGKTGSFDNELAEEFFQAFAFNAKITLHIKLLYGQNNHHKLESIFKALARALNQAVQIVSDEIPSSKGILE